MLFLLQIFKPKLTDSGKIFFLFSFSYVSGSTLNEYVI